MNRSNFNGLRILVLSRDMSAYRAAYYQQDFLSALSNQAECLFYGPGFPNYSLGKSLAEILLESSFEPDFVFTAHSFLEDDPRKSLETMPGLNLKSSPVPIFSLINKEYSKLSEKVQFFSDVGVQAVFTHHHNLEDFVGKIGIPLFFLPFGVNPFRFKFSGSKRSYDLGFAGLLKNPTFGDLQAETRIELMREIYFSVLNTPILRKAQYAKWRLIWKSWTGSPGADLIGRLLGHGKLSEKSYVDALRSTKAWLNLPSPLDIISTRYFECMASGTLVLAQKSPALEYVFPSHLMETFEHISELPLLLEKTLSDEAWRMERTLEARNFVLENHTWDITVHNMLDAIEGSVR